MGYAKGDVVLVAFPFRDKAAAKVRPAVVVSGAEYNRRGEVIIAAVTAHPPRVPSDFPIRGWREANLVAPSVVRIQLATITTRKILYQPGSLISDDLAKVNGLLKSVLELNQSKRS
jgi:mRNA-degrading endonuclease toxin of MazEF toxin-antitoxin module